MFHVHNNLFFEKLPGGNVKVIKYPDDTTWSNDLPSFPRLFELLIDTSAWASIISSMSAGGEENGRYYSALDFHYSVGPVAIVPNEHTK